MICRQLDNHSMPATNTSICPTVRNVSKGVRLDMCDRDSEWETKREVGVQWKWEGKMGWPPPAGWVSLPAPMYGNLCTAFKWISQGTATPTATPLTSPPCRVSVMPRWASTNCLSKHCRQRQAQDLPAIRSISWQEPLFVFDKCLALPSLSPSLSLTPSLCLSLFLSPLCCLLFPAYSCKTFYVLGSIRCDYEQSFWLFINLMTLHLATANVCLAPLCLLFLLVPVVVVCSLKHFRLDLYCEIKLKSFATEIKVKLIYFMACTLTGRVFWEESLQSPV